MEGDEIERYFQALDEELAERTLKKPVRLVVLGGVYMMFFLKNRSSTKDVDIVPLDFPDTMKPNQDTKVFRSAVNAVAKKFQLKRDWMNDVVAAFIPDLGPVSLWREYTNLHIYVPTAEYILALKLLAGREKDEDDIMSLCSMLHIETREQAQALVDRYAEPSWQNECTIQVTLDALF
jgi:predicted nucleotidyltransferase